MLFFHPKLLQLRLTPTWLFLFQVSIVLIFSSEKHLNKINQLLSTLDPVNADNRQGDLNWSRVVKIYLGHLSYPRVLGGKPVIYNGEIPRGGIDEGLVCPAIPGFVGKRQIGDDGSFGNETDSCASPEQISSISISSVAFVASVSSASVASVSRYVYCLRAPLFSHLYLELSATENFSSS